MRKLYIGISMVLIYDGNSEQMRTCEGQQVFTLLSILTMCLNQIKLPASIYMRATISELPYHIGSVGVPTNIHSHKEIYVPEKCANRKFGRRERARECEYV